MNIADYLSFIPLLLYGVALAELFSQWRRFFDREYLYWPYLVTTVVFIEIAIWNVYLFLFIAKDLESVNYFEYWIFLLQPILFLLLVHALTPDPEVKNTEGYFRKRMPVVFSLMGIYIASHMIPGLDTMDDMVSIPRLFAVAICIGIAISRKVYLVYLMGVLWLVSLFLRH
ncbi:MAG: hypothetical protein WBM43_03420 [Flavobacteriaceae bacterium]